MAVVLETTLGDITIDLYVNSRPKACLNFLKLCKMKYYNFNLFHTVNQGFIAQTGDPTGTRDGGESIWAVMDGPAKRYFEAENVPRIKHTTTGLVSFVGDKDNLIGSQFFITLASDLMYLDAQHCVFGEVGEGFDVLRALNEAICDTEHRPYKDIRITHTVVLDDPFPDPDGLKPPDCSPERTAERLAGGRIAPDEDVDETEGKSAAQIAEMIAEREAKARATILEMVGDIPDAEMAPPENVLFVCKLNPVTTDDDLEIIFSRFGKIKSCEVIRDKKTGDSLQYAFVEFDEQKSCEDAYFKMDNVLIDDRRIHVDFSQSVAKIKWLGKGRGVVHYDNNNKKEDDAKLDPDDDNNGKQQQSSRSKKSRQDRSRSRDRSYERSRDRRDYRERSRDRRNGNYRQSNYNNYYNNNYNNRQMQYRGRRGGGGGGGGGYYQNRYQMNNYRYRNEYDNRYHRNNRPRQNYRENQMNSRRRYDDRRYRSRSHDRRSSSRTRTTRRSLTPEDAAPAVEKRRKYDESDEEKYLKKDTAPTTPEEKRIKKNKKKSKSKKKKKYSSDSDSSSDSSSANDRKAKKKKSKKRDSSSESDSDSDASPKKKSRK